MARTVDQRGSPRRDERISWDPCRCCELLLHRSSGSVESPVRPVPPNDESVLHECYTHIRRERRLYGLILHERRA